MRELFGLAILVLALWVFYYPGEAREKWVTLTGGGTELCT